MIYVMYVVHIPSPQIEPPHKRMRTFEDHETELGEEEYKNYEEAVGELQVNDQHLISSTVQSICASSLF